jgi:hypothetical protein
MIAFHFPPCAGSSGLQRTLAFAREAAANDWRPLVLTLNRHAYPEVRDDQLADIPPAAVIRRTVALDAARHLAIAGRYWSRLAIPDRWRSWRWTAVSAGVRLVREHRPSVIWSTYPIATAHRIAAAIARRTGLPWIADFRDPMVEFDARTGAHFPTDPRKRAARLVVERETVSLARQLTFCTEGARRICHDRYPELDADRTFVLPNGFDETAFEDAERYRQGRAVDGRRILLHSGTIYAGPDRDPSALLGALSNLRAAGTVSPRDFTLRLRASSNDIYLRGLADRYGVADLIDLQPAFPYRQALAEMLEADALLLLQGSTSNPAVPAKLYEYLRAQRPILALVDAAGETAATLDAAGGAYQADPTQVAAVESTLRRLLTDLEHRRERVVPLVRAAEFSRARQASRWLELLGWLSAEKRDSDHAIRVPGQAYFQLKSKS